jgi:hypothetical protein
MTRTILIVVATWSMTAMAAQPATPAPQPIAPSTRPAQKSAEETLRQMLQSSPTAAQPIKPVPDAAPVNDATSGSGAVAPNAPTVPLIREGTLFLDRIGRITRTGDGFWWEFRLEADGSALNDPPMLMLPCKKLQQMEDSVRTSYRDLKIRISGEVMEYRGRNYLLVHRWASVADVAQPLQ